MCSVWTVSILIARKIEGDKGAWVSSLLMRVKTNIHADADEAPAVSAVTSALRYEGKKDAVPMYTYLLEYDTLILFLSQRRGGERIS